MLTQTCRKVLELMIDLLDDLLLPRSCPGHTMHTISLSSIGKPCANSISLKPAHPSFFYILPPWSILATTRCFPATLKKRKIYYIILWNLETRTVSITFCKLKCTIRVEKWLLDVVFIKITKSLVVNICIKLLRNYQHSKDYLLNMFSSCYNVFILPVPSTKN